MKNIFKILSSFILFFTLILESFAVAEPSNLKVDSVLESSVNLSWDISPDAFMYYVYYWKQSGLELWYEMQTDFVESTNIEIQNLDIWSTYYFTVIAVDENWEESLYSNEVVVDIKDNNTPLIDFAISSINVIWYDKLELQFTNLLDNSTWAIREFKITNKDDVLDTFDVVSNKLDIDDNSKLEISLDRDTTVWNSYEIVVIAITDSDWNNIESWIDNSEIFTVEEIVDDVIEEVEENIIEEEVIELESADEKESNWPNWATLEAKDVENTTLSFAKNNQSLPNTWPEHILLVILSIILASLIYVFKYKKV